MKSVWKLPNVCKCQRGLRRGPVAALGLSRVAGREGRKAAGFRDVEKACCIFWG